MLAHPTGTTEMVLRRMVTEMVHMDPTILFGFERRPRIPPRWCFRFAMQGGTKCGDIVLSPEVSWCEMAASWQSVTGTNLLPPEGTRTSTVAAELCDEVLTAVAVADDEP